MKYTVQFVAVLFVFSSFLVTPTNQASAATNTIDLSQFSTEQEKISHLKGILAILQAQLATLRATQGGTNISTNKNSNRNILSATLLSPRDLREDSVELRGRFDIDNEDYVIAWFEYGETKELYERTSRARVEAGNDETRVFINRLVNLDEDTTYYYRLVVENERGIRSISGIETFKTLDKNKAFSLIAQDRTLNQGETIVYEWYIPNNFVNSNNWIGIYEEGTVNSSPEKWSRANKSTGTISFRPTERGNYEARLFLDNTYNIVAVSELVTVSN